MRKYLYLIKKAKIKSWLKFWLMTNKQFTIVLSEILEGFSFDLQNTVKRYFKIFNIFGNSVQDGIPTPTNPVPIESVADDVNLFDKETELITYVYISSYEYSNGIYTIIPTGTGNPQIRLKFILPAGTYTLNSEAYLSIATILRNNNGLLNNFQAEYQNQTFTTTETSAELVFNWTNPNNTNPITLDLRTLKIQKGTTATPYSPYNQGTVTIKQRGKNLAYTGWAEDFVTRINNINQAKIETKDNRNCLKFSASAGYGDYDNKYMFKINWKENKQYTIQCSILNTSSQIINNYNIEVFYMDGTYNMIFLSNEQNKWLDFKFTTALNKTVKYITSAYYAGDRYLDLDTFMVYEGTEESSYEPYQANDYTFQTEPLRSLPNGVKDTIEADGIHRRVGRVVLDGSETINSSIWYKFISGIRSYKY